MSFHDKQGQRRHLRFKPDEIEFALIQFTDIEPDEIDFEAELAGLVFEEAYGGCGLVVLGTAESEEIQEGTRCNVKVGQLAPLQARIRWAKRLDDDVLKLGIEYLETT